MRVRLSSQLRRQSLALAGRLICCSARLLCLPARFRRCRLRRVGGCLPFFRSLLLCLPLRCCRSGVGRHCSLEAVDMLPQ